MPHAAHSSHEPVLVACRLLRALVGGNSNEATATLTVAIINTSNAEGCAADPTKTRPAGVRRAYWRDRR